MFLKLQNNISNLALLTFIRKIEQGKGNLNLEKANQVLKMFGHELAPVRRPVCFY